MTYPETLEYLYRLLPMYQRQGKVAFKKDLTNIRELCFRLQFPQWHFNSVHIGGTNGKGSVSAMMASILKEAGYKIGLYTSPHLKSFTERIQINGKEMSPKAVIQFVEAHKDLIEEIKPSFFELTVAMAFSVFAKEAVDLAVVEVGLGGRLDSTNIITPEISVITNISYDHQEMLGNTLESIASEKAGIIKKYTPVVIGEKHKETEGVFIQAARKLQAPIMFASDKINITVKSQDLYSQTFEVKGEINEELQTTYKLGLAGDYQMQNLAICLCTVDRLIEDGWEIPVKAIKRGLKKVRQNTGFAGRMQVLSETPLTICDTAHNEAGIESVMKQIRSMHHEEIHIVWGMVNDKQHDEILKLMPKDAKYYFAKPDMPRGLDVTELKGKCEKHGLKGETFNSVKLALNTAQKNAGTNDLVFVGGSTFVVAEVLD